MKYRRAPAPFRGYTDSVLRTSGIGGHRRQAVTDFPAHPEGNRIPQRIAHESRSSEASQAHEKARLAIVASRAFMEARGIEPRSRGTSE